MAEPRQDLELKEDTLDPVLKVKGSCTMAFKYEHAESGIRFASPGKAHQSSAKDGEKRST